MSNTLDLNTVAQASGMDQVSAKNYLQAEVFPKLELALNTVSFSKNLFA